MRLSWLKWWTLALLGTCGACACADEPPADPCREMVAPAVCSMAVECGESPSFDECEVWVTDVCVGKARAAAPDWGACEDELSSLSCGDRWFYGSCFK